MNFTQEYINMTIEAVKIISAKEGQKFCPHKAKSHMKKTLLEQDKKARAEIKTDAGAAGFGLKLAETKKPTRFQLHVGSIAMRYAATMWAKEIFKHSVTPQTIEI